MAFWARGADGQYHEEGGVATQQMVLNLRAERRRLSDQCSLILGRLQHGRASNKELSGMALNYRARISELRQRHHDIRVVFHNRTTGFALYALFVGGLEWGVEVQ